MHYKSLVPLPFGTPTRLVLVVLLLGIRIAWSGEPPLAPGTKGEYPSDLIYGIGHIKEIPWPQDQRSDLLPWFHDMGLRSARKSFSWLFTEPEPGTYDWSNIEENIPSVVDAGFTVVGLITDTPVWASHERARNILYEEGRDRFVGCLSNRDDTWPDYERWLEQVIQRYGHLSKHWEVRNEPDGMCGLYPKYWEGVIGGVGMGGDPVWYTELLKRTAAVIRALDPQAKVAVGGLECKRGLQTDFIDGIYEHGGQDAFDALCIHPYGVPFHEPFAREWLGTVRDIMVRHGDGHKPMWITEYNVEGKNDLDMSFTIRRKHRLLRETPWITIAIPLGTKYMFYGQEGANWPMQAIRHMQSNEFEARSSWKQDFEAGSIRLLRNWEWRAQDPDSSDWPEIGIEPNVGRDGSHGLHVRGRARHNRFWVCLLPYVRGVDPTFEAWFSPMPKTKGTPISVRVGMECLDILEPVRVSDVVADTTQSHVFQRLSFRVADHWPDWRDKGINMVRLEFSCEESGFSVALDDIHVY